jgi:hypothetical protein
MEREQKRTNGCVDHPCSDEPPSIPIRGREGGCKVSAMPLFQGGRGKGATHFAHRVRILLIEILDDTTNLTLKLQLAALDKVQTGCVDDGEQDAIESGLADFDARGLDRRRVLRRPVQEALYRRALVHGRCW